MVYFPFYYTIAGAFLQLFGRFLQEILKYTLLFGENVVQYTVIKVQLHGGSYL